MIEVTFKHRDLEEDYEFEAHTVFNDLSGPDAPICNSIRNAIMACQGLELDELDMDKDGVVTRIDGVAVSVLWTGHRNHQSETTL